MSEFIKQKTLLIKELTNTISHKVLTIDNEILGLIGSRDSDTKSSVGDKHETTRAKIQSEIDRLSKQKQLLVNQLHNLKSIDLTKKHKAVSFGSLVFTNQGIYFISIGIGQYTFDNNSYYVISSESPIGQLLHNKQVGNDFLFRNKVYKIHNII